jgi:hypothetical protein
MYYIFLKGMHKFRELHSGSQLIKQINKQFPSISLNPLPFYKSFAPTTQSPISFYILEEYEDMY